MHWGVDVEKLSENKGREGDRHNISERFVEEHDGSQHNCAALEGGLKEPDEERFDREWTAFLKSCIQRRILHANFHADIMVEDKREHWQASVHGSITKNEHAVVNGNGDEVEDAREDGLDDGDDETTMDDELREYSWTLVAESTVPKDQSAEMFELSNWEVWS